MKPLDVESITEGKREWMEKQQSMNTRELATWPQHLFESFVIVGLPPDMEITQIAEDLCDKEHRRDSLEDLRVNSQAVGLTGPGFADRKAAASIRTPPWPAYEPSVIFRYPQPKEQAGAATELSDKEIASLCFPNKVPPRRLKRSPSWSALNRVVIEKQRVTQEGRTFIFMLKVGSGLPLYGVCCYVEEVLHRPPLLAKDNFPSCNGPFRQCLIAAPRCYCLISRYPFFSLHFGVLGEILDMEHLHRVVQFNAEVAELCALVAGSSQGTGAAESSTAAPGLSTHSGSTAEPTSAGAAGSQAQQQEQLQGGKAQPVTAAAPAAQQHTDRALFQYISEAYGREGRDTPYKRRTHRKVLLLQHSQSDASTAVQDWGASSSNGQQPSLSHGADHQLASTSATASGRRSGAQAGHTHGSQGPAASTLQRSASDPSEAVAEESCSPESSHAPLVKQATRGSSAPASPSKGAPVAALSALGGLPAAEGISRSERTAIHHDSGQGSRRSSTDDASVGRQGQAQQQAGPQQLEAVQGVQGGSEGRGVNSRQTTDVSSSTIHGGQFPGGPGGKSSGNLDSQHPCPSAGTSNGASDFQPQPKALLDLVLAAEVPTPGDPLTLELSQLGALSSKAAAMHYTRPLLPGRYTVVGTPGQLQNYAEMELANCLQDWTLASAARLLSLDNLLAMLTCALLEQQIVVFCPDVAACSALVLSLVPMLRPFSMQGLLLPVTPTSLMSFIDAPVPFVLGLQYKTPDIQARCSDLIRVNVYKDQISNAVSLPLLPGAKELRAALLPHYQELRGAGSETGFSPAHEPRKADQAAAAGLASVLHAHLSAMLGDLRPHVITNVNSGKRTSMLMKSSLVESFPRNNRAFISAFVETQLFAVWCDQILSQQMELVA